jgi:hypothetical protein
MICSCSDMPIRSMYSLTDLTESTASEILACWLDCRSIVQLDSAACSAQQRSPFTEVGIKTIAQSCVCALGTQFQRAAWRH